MKKLTVATFVTAAFSLTAHASDYSTEVESRNADEKIPHSFETLDKNANGYISRDEAKGHEILDYFSKIDGITNDTADGKISEGELDKFTQFFAQNAAPVDEADSVTTTVRATEMEPPLATFGELDINGNGVISMDEAENHEFDRYFAFLDKNDDNKVSKMEYTHYMDNEASDSEE